MNDPEDNYDNEPIEEAVNPIGNNEFDSEDEDDFPDFANDENKKLNQLVSIF